MIFECPAYEVARQRCAVLFEPFGGWQAPAFVSPDGSGMREFMQQDYHRVAAFIHHCWMLRTTDPPDDYLFGDCLVFPEQNPSDTEYFDCLSSSSEFFDVEEDAFTVPLKTVFRV